METQNIATIPVKANDITRDLNSDTSFYKPRVLVVEDDLTFQPFWESVLENAGLNVTLDWATSKEQAVEMIRHQYRHDNPYEIVITDIWLEGDGTGIDLWNQFGEAVKNFVFVSGMPLSRADLNEALDFGFPPYLRKPFSKAICQQMIRTLIDQPK